MYAVSFDKLKVLHPETRSGRSNIIDCLRKVSSVERLVEMIAYLIPRVQYQTRGFTSGHFLVTCKSFRPCDGAAFSRHQLSR
jgi:hypothetical protein